MRSRKRNLTVTLVVVPYIGTSEVGTRFLFFKLEKYFSGRNLANSLNSAEFIDVLKPTNVANGANGARRSNAVITPTTL